MRWLAPIVALAACYRSPTIDPCTVSCNDTDVCPDSLMCFAGRCVATEGDTCSTPPDAYLAVSVGGRSACALGGDAAVYCWGDNTFGQLGSLAGSSPAPSGSAPARVLLPAAATAVSVGASHACAIAGGDVYCWGDDALGQVDGAASPDPIPLPRKALPQGGFDHVSTGGTATCAIGATAGLWCWGTLGTPGAVPPAQVAAPLQSVSVGFDHACGIDDTQAVWCWGANGSDQLGQSTTGNPVPAPTEIGLSSIVTITAGDRETCAIDLTGELFCWGIMEGVSPMDTGSSGWTAISIGAQVGAPSVPGLTCGIQNGMAMCWGTEQLGGLGDGRWLGVVARSAPVSLGPATSIQVGLGRVAGGATPVDVFEYDEGGCLLEGSVVSCWGSNRAGELGDGAPSQQPPALVAAPAGHMWKSLASGDEHVCATTEDDTVFCWGADDHGQVSGAKHPICSACDKPVPVVSAAVPRAETLVAGHGYTCALAGTHVTCWGDNEYHQLGMGDQDGIVDLGPGWGNVIGGQFATCGQNNHMECWGTINLKDTATAIPEPIELTQFPSFFADIQFGVVSTCAILAATQHRSCFGINVQGEFGDGSSMSNEAPTEIADLALLHLVTRFQHSCAITTDQGIYCWGSNNLGESDGTNVGVPAYTPNPVANLSNCTELGLGTASSCAICNNALSCWGDFQSGSVGHTGRAPAAPEVPLGLPWAHVSGGNDHMCALTSDNLMYCWGFGPRGELGTGVHGSAVPVQLGPRVP